MRCVVPLVVCLLSQQICLFFFDNAERLFRNISAPHGFRAQLLMRYLTDKARALVGRMDSSKSSDYNEVKSLILREFKLTPWAYLKRYQTTTV